MSHNEEKPVTLSGVSRRRFLTTMAGGAAGLLAGGIGSRALAANDSIVKPFNILRQSDVVLEFWFGEPPENGPAALAEAFMAANPGIKVVPTRYVNDDTGNAKLDAGLAGGATIDVYMTYTIPRLSARIGAGAAEDLTPYIMGDADLKAFVESASGLYLTDGKYFNLPTVREPHAIIINKNLLDAAGLEVPKAWTLEEFLEMAKKLSKSDGSVFGAWSAPMMAHVMLGSNRWYKEGAKESNFDHPAFRQYMEVWRGMVDNGSSYPWTEVLAQKLKVYQQGPFLTGQMALWPTSQFNLRYVNDLEKFPHDFVTTFAPYPTIAGVDSPFNPGGINNYILINAKTKFKDAAWQFIRFRMMEGAKYMLKSSKAPSFPGTPADDIVAGILGPNRDKLYDVEAYRRVMVEPEFKLVNDTIGVAAAQISAIETEQTDRCLIGEISVDDWVRNMKEQADAAIKTVGG